MNLNVNWFLSPFKRFQLLDMFVYKSHKLFLICAFMQLPQQQALAFEQSEVMDRSKTERAFRYMLFLENTQSNFVPPHSQNILLWSRLEKKNVITPLSLIVAEQPNKYCTTGFLDVDVRQQLRSFHRKYMFERYWIFIKWGNIVHIWEQNKPNSEFYYSVFRASCE